MVILRNRYKITDFLLILAWASPFNNPTQNCLNQIIIRSGSSWTYVILLIWDVSLEYSLATLRVFFFACSMMI